jgi:hypothetical protein
MANDITSNPWQINTVPFSYPYRVYIANLNITNAAATDTVLIKDNNGKTILSWTADASQTSYRPGKIGWVNGVVITTGGLGTTAVIELMPGSGK